MKRIQGISTTLLALTLSAGVFVFAADEQGGRQGGRQEQARPAQPPRERAQPQGPRVQPQAPRQQPAPDQNRIQAQGGGRRPPDRQPPRMPPRAPARPPDQGQQAQRQGPRQGRPETPHPAEMRRTPDEQQAQRRQQELAWRQHRAGDWDFEHRTWRDRGGYRGYRIPAFYFAEFFGPFHFFRAYSLPLLIVEGYPTFQLDGYWVSVLDPYPPYWGDLWYETDEVYIDWVGDGYYLFNCRYPGRAGIAVSLSIR